MAHRFSTWWRALGVVLLSLATVTWPSAARAATTPHFTIEHQSAQATLSSFGTAGFATSIAVTPAKGPVLVDVTIYPFVRDRGELAPIVSGTGTTAPALSSTGRFQLGCLRGGRATFDVALYVNSLHAPMSTCGAIAPALHLKCPTQGCQGVYPIRYEVFMGATRETTWSLLAIRTGHIVRPLQVALIDSLTPHALAQPKHAVAALNELGHYASLPVTLSAGYQALSSIDLSTPSDLLWQRALTAALASPEHRVIEASPTSVDFAGLAKYGFTTEITRQLSLTQTLLTALTGRYLDAPVFVQGVASPASLSALHGAGVNNVVLPENDLSEAPSTTLTWGAPFHLTDTAGVSALAVDNPLSALVADTTIGPGRRAALTLGTLAFLHLEAPDASATRTVVITAPLDTTSKTYLADLLGGLRHDSFARLSDLSPSFNSSLIATNGAPSTRQLASSETANWSSLNVTSLTQLASETDSYAHAVKSTAIATSFEIAVARAEIFGSTNGRQRAISAANAALNRQLRLFSIDNSAITLAGPDTSLPVTVLSQAQYSVNAVVHLVTDRLNFPLGSNVPVTLSSPTKSLRIATSKPRGSSLTLQVVLTTPDGNVVLARSAIQVRIAGTSIVGYVLTFASMACSLCGGGDRHDVAQKDGTLDERRIHALLTRRVDGERHLVSRITGLFRVLVLAWVLGFTPISDAFNLANTVPNMLFDLVLGGIATATFIPVFVERLALDGERRAWRSISNVVTGAIIVLFCATVAAWFLAPWIIEGFTVLQHSSSPESAAILTQQRAVATELLRWFVPQIFFYGVIGVATALLNIRRRFGIATWVPVANNLVCIGVLVWFHLVDPTPVLSALSGSRDLMWLGLGTTLGVAVQFLCLLPSLARSDLWRLSFRFDRTDPALRAVSRLGSWTLLVVLANQVSLYVVLAYAFGIGGDGPVSAYTYGWSFMQMPYAVVVVSVMGALTPQLARFATDEDYVGLSDRLRFGLRQSLVIIVPCTLILIVLAQPIVGILLNHVNATHRIAAGTVLAVLAAGLPGFTVFQLAVRGLQAMQRARDVFLLYLLENALTIALCVALGRHSIAGLTASVSLGYTITAFFALATLSRHHVDIVAGLWSVHVRRSLIASLVATLVMALVYAVPTWTRGLGLVVRFSGAFLLGTVVYGLVVLTLRSSVRRTQSKGARLGPS